MIFNSKLVCKVCSIIVLLLFSFTTNIKSQQQTSNDVNDDDEIPNVFTDDSTDLHKSGILIESELEISIISDATFKPRQFKSIEYFNEWNKTSFVSYIENGRKIKYALLSKNNQVFFIEYIQKTKQNETKFEKNACSSLDASMHLLTKFPFYFKYKHNINDDDDDEIKLNGLLAAWMNGKKFKASKSSFDGFSTTFSFRKESSNNEKHDDVHISIDTKTNQLISVQVLHEDALHKIDDDIIVHRDTKFSARVRKFDRNVEKLNRRDIIDQMREIGKYCTKNQKPRLQNILKLSELTGTSPQFSFNYEMYLSSNNNQKRQRIENFSYKLERQSCNEIEFSGDTVMSTKTYLHLLRFRHKRASEQSPPGNQLTFVYNKNDSNKLIEGYKDEDEEEENESCQVYEEKEPQYMLHNLRFSHVYTKKINEGEKNLTSIEYHQLETSGLFALLMNIANCKQSLYVRSIERKKEKGLFNKLFAFKDDYYTLVYFVEFKQKTRLDELLKIENIQQIYIADIKQSDNNFIRNFDINKKENLLAEITSIKIDTNANLKALSVPKVCNFNESYYEKIGDDDSSDDKVDDDDEDDNVDKSFPKFEDSFGFNTSLYLSYLIELTDIQANIFRKPVFKIEEFYLDRIETSSDDDEIEDDSAADNSHIKLNIVDLTDDKQLTQTYFFRSVDGAIFRYDKQRRLCKFVDYSLLDERLKIFGGKLIELSAETNIKGQESTFLYRKFGVVSLWKFALELEAENLANIKYLGKKKSNNLEFARWLLVKRGIEFDFQIQTINNDNNNNEDDKQVYKLRSIRFGNLHLTPTTTTNADVESKFSQVELALDTQDLGKVTGDFFVLPDLCPREFAHEHRNSVRPKFPSLFAKYANKDDDDDKKTTLSSLTYSFNYKLNLYNSKRQRLYSTRVNEIHDSSLLMGFLNIQLKPPSTEMNFTLLTDKDNALYLHSQEAYKCRKMHSFFNFLNINEFSKFGFDINEKELASGRSTQLLAQLWFQFEQLVSKATKKKSTALSTSSNNNNNVTSNEDDDQVFVTVHAEHGMSGKDVDDVTLVWKLSSKLFLAIMKFETKQTGHLVRELHNFKELTIMSLESEFKLSITALNNNDITSVPTSTSILRAQKALEDCKQELVSIDRQNDVLPTLEALIGNQGSIHVQSEIRFSPQLADESSLFQFDEWYSISKLTTRIKRQGGQTDERELLLFEDSCEQFDISDVFNCQLDNQLTDIKCWSNGNDWLKRTLSHLYGHVMLGPLSLWALVLKLKTIDSKTDIKARYIETKSLHEIASSSNSVAIDWFDEDVVELSSESMFPNVRFLMHFRSRQIVFDNDDDDNSTVNSFHFHTLEQVEAFATDENVGNNYDYGDDKDELLHDARIVSYTRFNVKNTDDDDDASMMINNEQLAFELPIGGACQRRLSVQESEYFKMIANRVSVKPKSDDSYFGFEATLAEFDESNTLLPQWFDVGLFATNTPLVNDESSSTFNYMELRAPQAHKLKQTLTSTFKLTNTVDIKLLHSLDLTSGECLVSRNSNAQPEHAQNRVLVPLNAHSASSNAALTFADFDLLFSTLDEFELIRGFRAEQVAYDEQIVLERRVKASKLSPSLRQVFNLGDKLNFVSIIRKANIVGEPKSELASTVRVLTRLLAFGNNRRHPISRLAIQVHNLMPLTKLSFKQLIKPTICLSSTGVRLLKLTFEKKQNKNSNQQQQQQQLNFSSNLTNANADANAKVENFNDALGEFRARFLLEKLNLKLLSLGKYLISQIQLLNFETNFEFVNDKNLFIVKFELLERPTASNYFSRSKNAKLDDKDENNFAFLVETLDECSLKCDEFSCRVFSFCEHLKECRVLNSNNNNNSEARVIVVANNNEDGDDCSLYSADRALLWPLSEKFVEKLKQQQAISASNNNTSSELDIEDASGLWKFVEIYETFEDKTYIDEQVSSDDTIDVNYKKANSLFVKSATNARLKVDSTTPSVGDSMQLAVFVESRNVDQLNDCFAQCNYGNQFGAKTCTHLSFCARSGDCATALVGDTSDESMRVDLHLKLRALTVADNENVCTVYARDFITQYFKQLNNVDVPSEFYALVNDVDSLTECALLCQQSAQCLSLDYCLKTSSSMNNACYLQQTHALVDKLTINSNKNHSTTNNGNCTHLYKTLDNAFEKLAKRRLIDAKVSLKPLQIQDLPTTSFVDVSQCAVLCSRARNCVGFEFCIQQNSASNNNNNIKDNATTLTTAAATTATLAKCRLLVLIIDETDNSERLHFETQDESLVEQCDTCAVYIKANNDKQQKPNDDSKHRATAASNWWLLAVAAVASLIIGYAVCKAVNTKKRVASRTQ